jgi:hypothetical protein
MAVLLGVPTVMPVHKEVHQRARKQKDVRQCLGDVVEMAGEQDVCPDGTG